MIDSFRILTLMSLHQVFKHFGAKRLNAFVFIIGSFYELLLSPFRKKSHRSKSLGEALLKTAQKAGPIYIKFGQTISTRPDIIGEEIAEHLGQLRDKIPPFSYSEVQAIITSELGERPEDVFYSFEKEPVAAASISQVHDAILKSGERVAVKVLRPGIQKQYQRDVKLLYFWARVVTRFSSSAKRLKPIEVVDLFERVMNQELDLSIEGASSCEIKDNCKNDDILKIPTIYWRYTTREVLTMEWVDGISIYDLEAIKDAGLDTILISQKIARMFFNQAYRDGCFHADLHPGNVMVTRDGKIALVDFGIVGRLPEKDRLAVTEILHGFLQKDYTRIAKIHANLGYIPSSADMRMFALSCRALGENIVGQQLKNISVAKLLSQLFKLTRDFGMETQPQLLLLQKTTVVVEGIGRLLNPEINMWQLAEPWMKKWAAKNLSPEAKLLRVAKKVIDRMVDKLD